MAEQTASVPKAPPFPMRIFRGFGLLRESVVAMVGLGLIAFWVVLAIFADVIAPYPPNANFAPMQVPWATDAQGNFYLLGTDHLGRDIFSRIVYGSRRVLLLAPLATLCAYLVGVPMGLAAGYLRGRWDDVLSFVANVILSFPVLVLYVLIIATVGASALNILIAIIFASGPGIMRIVRGLALELRNREYIAAAQTRGESALYIMFVEMLPNARGPIIVDACLRVGYVTITIGVLGFLGLGLPPPDPDWGGMINETRQLAMMFPHMAVFPCIAISSLVLGFNLLADGFREISLRD